MRDEDYLLVKITIYNLLIKGQWIFTEAPSLLRSGSFAIAPVINIIL